MDNVQDDKSIPSYAKLPKVVVEIQVPPPAKWNLRKKKNQLRKSELKWLLIQRQTIFINIMSNL